MKNKFTKAVFCLVLLAVCFTTIFAACKYKPTDDSDLQPDSSKIIAKVAVSESKININLSSIRSDVGSGTCSVVAVKAYEYVSGDKYSGLSANVLTAEEAVTSRKIGTYTLGETSNISVDRIVQGYDGLYNKYYVLDEECNIVKGPVYATEIEAQNGDSAPESQSKPLSKKGLFADWDGLAAYKDLGASHTVINLAIEEFVCPNEIVSDGKRVPIAHPDDAVEFTSNGVKYYFRKTIVDEFDEIIGDYAAAGAQITAILLARPNANEETFPQSMTYAPWSTDRTSVMALNTSNELGFEYYVAIMEFLAKRYTENDGAKGFISNFVIGNEVDYARDYNRISEKQAHIDTYMEEYSRLLRLTNLAVKKYNSSITVSIPITQNWAEKGYGVPGDIVGAYVPKQMIEWLNTKTKSEGDYDWSIAPHVYGYHLAQAGVFYLDTYKAPDITVIQGGRNAGMTNDYETTSKITFSNLELLDDYLNQDGMKYNGNVRKVYMTESGVSTYWRDKDYSKEGLALQAATIAAAYYKVSQLDSIVSFCYYRAYDNEIEASSHALFGLHEADRTAKPSYEVYKYIDTQYSQLVANKYIDALSYFDYNTLELQKYGKGFNSYTDLLNIYNTKHDFGEFDWKRATPVTAPTVYEWEDKIDMGSVKLESKAFMYDGKEHSLAISGTLPEGVTVTYSENNSLTNIGIEEVTATFTKNDEVVAIRKATLEVTKIYTDKKVYALDEKIYVTAYIDENLAKNAWLGIFREDDNIEKDPSRYWYYLNTNGDRNLRTVCLQEQIDNLQGGVTAGTYTIVYFANGGYDVLYSTQIKVVANRNITDDVSGVTLADDAVVYNGKMHTMTVNGNLPEGVSVRYTNNEQTEVGVYQVMAELIKDGKVIATRYAVLTIEADNVDRLTTSKTSYEVGEDIMVTATAVSNAPAESWWVGLYLKEDDLSTGIHSIYWYYTRDDAHINGTAYNIRDQKHNSERADYVTIPVGNYKLVLFDGEGEVVKSVEFFVVPSTVTEKGTITTDKTTYTQGESVMVTATCSEKIGSKVYWVGIYKKGEKPDDVYSIYWYYVKDENHTSGTAYDIKLQKANDRADFSVVGSLPAGEYTLVLFNNSGYSVETSVDITITGGDTPTPPTPTVPDVVLDKTVYEVGEAINVTCNVAEGSTAKTWWVGVYGDGEQPSGDIRSYLWYYVEDGSHVNGGTYNILVEDRSSGRIDKAELPAGKYQVLLFAPDGSVVLSAKFTVKESEVVEEKAIKTNKKEYAFGEDVLVTATCPADVTDWWVGLYLKNEDPTQAGVSSIYWYSVVDANHVSGTAYNIKSQTANKRTDYLDLPAGEYKMVLFNTSGYTVQDVAYFTIAASADTTEPTLTIGKNTFNAGETIEFTTVRPMDGKYYWWGLYNADQTPGGDGVVSINWGEVNQTSKNFTLENLTAGSYKVVLFDTSGFTAVATIEFTVVAAGE